MRDKVFPSDFMYFMTYTQNVLWVFTDYQSDLSPFLAHTWSLAIEEQFYLLWPFIIFSFRFLLLMPYQLNHQNTLLVL